MLNYLLELNISPEEIYDITHSLPKEMIDVFELSSDLVIDTLTYYKSIGVKNLNKLITSRPDLVLINKKEIESTISKLDKDKIVNIINNDIEDLILFGI